MRGQKVKDNLILLNPMGIHRRGHNLPWKLRQRTSKEVRKKVYVCPEPTFVHHDPLRALGDLTGIKKHFLRKHSEKKWKCEKCPKRYAVQSDWKAHSKTCGTVEYRCDCGTLFARKDSFITHRAFCKALADESASTITATNSLYAPTEPPDLSSSLSHLERIFPVERELASLFVEKDSASFRSEASGTSTCTEQVPLWKWILVVFNLTLELPSAAFDQLSLSQKPLYALVAMTLFLLAFALCVIELLYNGLKKGITFKRPEDKIPWFYYPPRSRNPKRFGTFADLIGLVSAIS
ncbi:hypothetical protein SLEP1_g40739 [Rubroshorea leprosula]|uniref:Uncharacterized protein n=1 Tax=Rubroshorea leprosula TaxID=152421 RepID=A0AAV5L4D0_9ROSI|nr:hypothetical protein SLEP1_g40739 [Rubroshorea leprosula]